MAPLLEIAREQDDARVDAVADDDASEKRRVGIEVPDGRATEREGERGAGGERADQKRNRSEAAVVEKDDEADRQHHQRAGELEVSDQLLLRFDHLAHFSVVADDDVCARWIELAHRVFHRGEQLLVSGESQGGGLRANHHGQRVLVAARQVSVGEVIDGRGQFLDGGAEMARPIRSRRRSRMRRRSSVSA